MYLVSINLFKFPAETANLYYSNFHFFRRAIELKLQLLNYFSLLLLNYFLAIIIHSKDYKLIVYRLDLWF
jgi:hypothetical protein